METFGDLTPSSAHAPKPRAAAAGGSTPTVGVDSRVKLALLVGGGLAVVLMGLMAVAVLAVVLWARTARQPPVLAADVPSSSGVDAKTETPPEKRASSEDPA